jgi:ketosteroid isomerase-like protein
VKVTLTASKAEDQMNRRFLITAATAAGVLAVPTMAQETGAKLLPKRFAETLSSHDIAAFATLFAEDYVTHQMSAAAPAPPPDRSPKQATVGFFAARLAGIPDLKVAVETTVASNDMVAASFAYTGTHGGTYFGVARPIVLSFPKIISGRIGDAAEPRSEWRQWRQIVGRLEERMLRRKKGARRCRAI